MAVDTVEFVAYGLLPSIVGAAVGWLLLARARDAARTAGGRPGSPVLPWWALGMAPTTCLLLALVGTATLDADEGQAGALAMMGAVTGVGAVAAGHLGAKLLAVADPDAAWPPKALILTLLLLTPVMFTFIAFFLTQDAASLQPNLVWTMGVAAAATAVLQDAMASRPRIDAASREALAYGRLLVRMVVPETIVLAAFVFFFVQMPEPVPA